MSLQEFQVIIMAGGFGKHLNPLVEETPKSLLPVCNRPILSYQLEMVENAGFQEVLIITRGSNAEQIRRFCHEVYRGKLKVELSELVDYIGNAQALIRLKDKIKKDFIVISGDLIAESSFIHAMVDSHRARGPSRFKVLKTYAALTMLLKEKAVEDPTQAQVAPGGRKRDTSINFVGIEPKTNRLLLISSSDDNQTSFKINRTLLTTFPHMVLHTNLLDPHFYIFSHWTLEWFEKTLPSKKKGASLRKDFIPSLLRFQYAERTGADLKASDNVAASTAGIGAPNTSKEPLESKMASTFSDPADRVFCQAFQLDSKALCIRTNKMGAFMDACRDLATGTKFYKPLEPVGKGNFIAASAVISGKTQIGTECVVSDSTTIGDRASVKKSVIGKHCVIGTNVKIINSVLLDHVKIKDGAKIQNCVICSNVYIEENAELIDSAIGPKCEIPADEKIKKETVTQDRNSDSDSDEMDDDE